MEIVKNFGLDPFLFGAQVINFLIVLYLLKRFMYKPVLSMLRKRENSIREGLEKAEEGRLLFEKAVEREKEVLRKSNENAKITIAQARQEAVLIASQIEENTKKQAEEIIKQAREQIEIETKEAEKKLSVKISELSVELLTRAIKDMFSEKEQKEVVEKALQRIGKN